jgi:hypothetical protein
MPAPSGETTIVDSLSSRLSGVGIELPKPPTPLGAYVDSSDTGNLFFLSGTLLVVNGKLASTMQVRGGTRRRLGPGQVFYESPEDVHTVSRNTSKTKPAKFVVFFIKSEGAPTLTPIH